MKAIVTINMDNAAFQECDDPSLELSRILEKLSRDVCRRLLSDGELMLLQDINGNRVGKLIINE